MPKLTIFHPDHPHFRAHKAFVEGSFANPDNPPVVQSLYALKWTDNLYPSWDPNREFRIKPRTITRTVTYPEPMREAPAVGTAIWIVGTEYSCPQITDWMDAGFKTTALKNGMVFATEADAQQCYDALFGEQK